MPDDILERFDFLSALNWDQLQANNVLLILGVVFFILVVLRSIFRSLLGILLFRLRPLIMVMLASTMTTTPVAGLGGFESLPAWNKVRYTVCDTAGELDRALSDVLPVRFSDYVCGSK